MTDDRQMLECISETADMGQDSLRQVLDKTDNPDLQNALQLQLREYKDISDSAAGRLADQDIPPKKAGAFAKINSRLVSELKTMAAADPASQIAQMVTEGSTMGVTKMTQKLHDYSGDNAQIVSLSHKLIQTEQANIEQMHRFL